MESASREQVEDLAQRVLARVVLAGAPGICHRSPQDFTGEGTSRDRFGNPCLCVTLRDVPPVRLPVPAPAHGTLARLWRRRRRLPSFSRGPQQVPGLGAEGKRPPRLPAQPVPAQGPLAGGAQLPDALPLLLGRARTRAGRRGGGASAGRRRCANAIFLCGLGKS